MIEVIEGEVGKDVPFHCIRGDGSDFDLTGATVTLLVGTQTARTCSLVTADQGRIKHTTVAGAQAFTLGQFQARLKVVNGGNTFYSQIFDVHCASPDLPEGEV
jgi:hypothetical protein